MPELPENPIPLGDARPQLNQAERRAIWDSCGLLLRISQGPMLADLGTMIGEANRAETLGPLLEPSAWLGAEVIDTHLLVKDVLKLCAAFRVDVAALEQQRLELLAKRET